MAAVTSFLPSITVRNKDRLHTMPAQPLKWSDIFCMSSLRFTSPVSEKAYLAARSDELARHCALVSAVIFVVTGFSMLIEFTDQHPGYPSEATSVMLMAQLSLLFVTALGFGFTATQRGRRELGSAGVENVAIGVSYFTVLVMVVPVDAYYLPVLMGLGKPPGYCEGGQIFTDTPMILRQTALLACTHFLLPLRWVRLWLSEVLSVILVGLCLIILGSPEGMERGVGNFLALFIIVCSISLGKRIAEITERASFDRVLQEKTRRVGTEHRLTRLTMWGRGTSPGALSMTSKSQTTWGRCTSPGSLSMTSKSQISAADVEETNSITALSLSPKGAPTPLTDLSDAGGGEEKSTPVSEHIFGDIVLDSSDKKVTEAEWMSLHDRLVELKTIGIEEHWLLRAADVDFRTAEVSAVGGFGKLQRGSFHGMHVVVKGPEGAENSRRYLTSVLSLVNELRIFRHLRHPNIVLFHGAFLNESGCRIGIVLEHVDGTTLKAVIEKPPGKPSMHERWSLLLDICLAVRYLHSQRPCIVHGDLKPENILVESMAEGLRAKLIDFGLSTLVSAKARVLGSTAAYAAPEIRLRPSECPTPKADVFAFALVACYTITAESPLQGYSISAVVAAVRADTFQEFVKVDWPEGVPFVHECKVLCISCCVANPFMRPSMQRIHKQLQGWCDNADD